MLIIGLHEEFTDMLHISDTVSVMFAIVFFNSLEFPACIGIGCFCKCSATVQGMFFLHINSWGHFPPTSAQSCPPICT